MKKMHTPPDEDVPGPAPSAPPAPTAPPREDEQGPQHPVELPGSPQPPQRVTPGH